MRIISTPAVNVNTTAQLPQPAPVTHPVPAGDAGALSPASELDVDRNGTVDAADVTRLEQNAESPVGPAAWKLNQARIMAALGHAGTDGTVRGTLALGAHTPATGNLAASDVLAGIQQLDTSKLRAAGVPLVATFDFDDTLAHGDVFIPAMAALAARKQFDPAGDAAIRAALVKSNVPAELIERGDVNDRAALLTKLIVPAGTALPIPGAKPIAIPDAFFAFGDGMRGMNVASAKATMADAFANGVPEAGIAPIRTSLFDGPSTHDSAREMVDGVRATGIDPWIVSWGYDFIAHAAAPYAGIADDHVLGSDMAIGPDGRFTGLVTKQSSPKSEMIRDHIGAPPTVAFGNSGSDLPMIDAAFGPTFMVKPEAQPSPLTGAVQQRAGRTYGMDYELPGTAYDADRAAKLLV